MTDRASAEDINELHSLIAARLALRERIESLIDDDEAAYVSVALIRAALRDTGPRLDSGIDVERLARAMHASEVGCARPTSLCVWEAPFSESHRALATAIAAEYARLSTPRTETSDD